MNNERTRSHLWLWDFEVAQPDNLPRVTQEAGSHPDSWEIDEPGYGFGDIFDNLLLGSLDNTNNVPSTFPDDVSMAIGFRLGDLQPLDTATINVFFSEDGDSIGSLTLTHFDIGVGSTDTFTMSGQSSVEPVPEPSSLAIGLVLTGLAVAGGWRVRRRKAAQDVPNDGAELR